MCRRDLGQRRHLVSERAELGRRLPVVEQRPGFALDHRERVGAREHPRFEKSTVSPKLELRGANTTPCDESWCWALVISGKAKQTSVYEMAASSSSASAPVAKRQRQMSGTILIFRWEPTIGPLPKARQEAQEVAALFSKEGWECIQTAGGDASDLRAQLEAHRPAILHCIVHADVKHPASGDLTLGLTDAAGGLVRMLQTTLVDIIGSSSNYLEFVFINGCKSEALCCAVALCGIPCLGYSTLVDDTAAAAVAPAVYEHILREKPEHLADALSTAFQQANNAIRALSRAGTDAFVIADPQASSFVQQGQSHLDRYRGHLLSEAGQVTTRRASGIPVLVAPTRFRVVTGGLSPPSMPNEFRQAALFTGQQEELDALRAAFFPLIITHGDAQPEVKRGTSRQAILQAIRGLGGVGKTEMALEFARRNIGRYPSGVLFINADVDDDLVLLQRFARAVKAWALAEMTDADRLREGMSTWFREHPGWLLIIDNVDSASALSKGGLIDRNLPAPDAPGHVLMTSRVGTDSFRAIGFRTQTLSTLSTAAAEILLVREASAEPIDEPAAIERMGAMSNGERKALAWLAGGKGLAGLPLALVQTGKYVQNSGGLTFREYRERYELLKLELFEGEDVQGTQKALQSVHMTWLLNFRQLRREQPAAAELLLLCALFGPDDIPADMFANFDHKAGETDASPALTEAITEVVSQGGSVATQRERRRHVVTRLVKAAQRYSLLELGAEGKSISMHRLVQEAQRRDISRGQHDAEGLISLSGKLLDDWIGSTTNVGECPSDDQAEVQADWCAMAASTLSGSLLLHCRELCVLESRFSGESADIWEGTAGWLSHRVGMVGAGLLEMDPNYDGTGDGDDIQ